MDEGGFDQEPRVLSIGTSIDHERFIVSWILRPDSIARHMLSSTCYTIQQGVQQFKDSHGSDSRKFRYQINVQSAVVWKNQTNQLEMQRGKFGHHELQW